MSYRAQDEGARGSFDWELYYKRLPLLPEDLKQPAEPFKYATFVHHFIEYFLLYTKDNTVEN